MYTPASAKSQDSRERDSVSIARCERAHAPATGGPDQQRRHSGEHGHAERRERVDPPGVEAVLADDARLGDDQTQSRRRDRRRRQEPPRSRRKRAASLNPRAEDEGDRHGHEPDREVEQDERSARAAGESVAIDVVELAGRDPRIGREHDRGQDRESEPDGHHFVQARFEVVMRGAAASPGRLGDGTGNEVR
ncbi:MAG: hypothetical protein ACR2OO_04275 [Thermomicrobiales bacterium]